MNNNDKICYNKLNTIQSTKMIKKTKHTSSKGIKGIKGKKSKGKKSKCNKGKATKGTKVKPTGKTSKHSNSSSSSISKSQRSLLQLIKNTIESSRGVKKSQNNLASKLIDLTNKNNMKNRMKHTMQGEHSYSKAVQSSYTFINKNGKKQEYGQTIENESTKPYIEISKLHNGDVNYYKIPRK
jgi:hypothetical protein